MDLTNTDPTFSLRLREWYAFNHRKLPWRETQDPYRVWLSEIILQQTRVQQGLPYYERYVEHFPTVNDLADAPEDEVLRLWQGLGYYSRARNLHHAAKQVCGQYGGVFPASSEALKKLKGIGDYTAAAVASFAFGEKVAVVDGNVYRVLARVFGIATDIASPEGKREFANLANALLPESGSPMHNQAVMEFGALHCTPQSPQCSTCPLGDICEAKARGLQASLPVKEKKIEKKERHLHYCLFEHGGNILGKKRGPGDIWQGLYDFFCIEEDRTLSQAEMADRLGPELQGAVWAGHTEPLKHQLTHQRLYVTFFRVEIKDAEKFLRLSEKKTLEIINFKRWHELPKPILLAKYLHSSADALNFAPAN